MTNRIMPLKFYKCVANKKRTSHLKQIIDVQDLKR